MGIGQLNEAELKLVKAAYKGITADLRNKQNENATIRGEIIRHLFLGLPIPEHEALKKELKNYRRLSGCGLKIKGADIQGAVDLTEVTGPDGNGCPSLIFEDCRFLTNNDEPNPDERRLPNLDVSHAKLNRLSLVNCRANYLSLIDACISSDVEIDNLQSIQSNKLCRINAKGIKIDGSFKVSNTTLRLAQTTGDKKGSLVDHALALQGARINGDIHFRPDFVAYGGISVQNIKLSGDLWIDGGKLIADQSYALTGQTAHIGGILGLTSLFDKKTSSKNNQPGSTKKQLEQNCFVAEGGIHFMAAQIGSVLMTGAQLKAVKDNRNNLLNFAQANIRHNVNLDTLSKNRGGFHFKSEYPVNFWGATIAGRFSAIGATFKGARNMNQLTCYNLSVGLDLNLTNSTVNTLNLTHAKIGKTLILAKTNIEYVDAEYISVTGDVKWDGEINNKADFMGAKIDGKFHLGDTEKWSPLRFIRISGNIPELSLEDANIAKDLSVHTMEVHQSPASEKIKSVPLAIQKKRLPFYNTIGLHEAYYPYIDKEKDKDFFYALNYLYDKRSKTYDIIHGKSDLIYKINNKIGINLSKEHHASEYLKFFCANVWGEAGPFTIIDSREMLGRLIKSGSGILSEADSSKDAENESETTNLPDIQPPDFIKNEKEYWRAKAYVLYQGYLFKSLFEIRKNGLIEMVDDEPLMDLNNELIVDYNAPFRIIDYLMKYSKKDNKEEISTSFYSFGSAVEWEPLHSEEINKHYAYIKNYFDTINITDSETGTYGLKINLKGLTIDNLNDGDGKKWDESAVLELEGFRYNRFESAKKLTKESKDSFDYKKDTPFYKKIADYLKSGAYAFISLFTGHNGLSDNEANKNVWELRIDWLNKQYKTDEPEEDEFHPQPYEQAAKVFRDQGDYDYAENILIEKLRIKRGFSNSWFRKIGSSLIDNVFGYGVRLRRVSTVFILSIIFGWFLVDVANYGVLRWPFSSFERSTDSYLDLQTIPVLVVDAQSVTTMALTETEGPLSASIAREPITIAQDGSFVREIRCRDQIESLLYAIDSFVPLLDLKQESKCTISAAPHAWPWRILKTLYTILGWIITSGLILTVSGVVRRQVER